jgi:hypothetical protein
MAPLTTVEERPVVVECASAHTGVYSSDVPNQKVRSLSIDPGRKSIQADYQAGLRARRNQKNPSLIRTPEHEELTTVDSLDVHRQSLKLAGRRLQVERSP